MVLSPYTTICGQIGVIIWANDRRYLLSQQSVVGFSFFRSSHHAAPLADGFALALALSDSLALRYYLRDDPVDPLYNFEGVDPLKDSLTI